MHFIQSCFYSCLCYSFLGVFFLVASCIFHLPQYFLPDRLRIQNTRTTSLQRDKTPQRVSWYDIKQSGVKASLMLELWGMRSTSSLSLLPCSIWPGVVVIDRVLFMGQTEQLDIQTESKSSSPSSPSSSYNTASMDLHDPLSPLVPIVHRSREVFQATSCIGTGLLYIGSSWSSCLCSSLQKGPHMYFAKQFVLTFPAVSHTSGSSNLYSFVMCGRWLYTCCLVECYLQELFRTA